MNFCNYWMKFCNYCNTNINEIEAKDAEIARLRAALKEQIDAMKCCGNCKWDVNADEEFCDGCCMPELNKWEAR